MSRRFSASSTPRTISTFSCDIPRAVSRRLRSRREHLAPAGYVPRGNDAIASLNDFLKIGPHLVPGVKPTISDPHGPVDAVEARVVVLEREPFDFRMEGGLEGVCISLEG